MRPALVCSTLVTETTSGLSASLPQTRHPTITNLSSTSSGSSTSRTSAPRSSESRSRYTAKVSRVPISVPRLTCSPHANTGTYSRE